MKLLAVLIVVLLLTCLLSGCFYNNKHTIKYYPNGQIQEETTDTSNGFDPKWSGGDGKQMPLSHFNINGVKAGL